MQSNPERPGGNIGAYTDIYSKYSFCVSLNTPDVFFTEKKDDVSYPTIARAKDIALVFKSGGKTYGGHLAKISDNSRLYGFMVEGMEKAPTSGTLIIENYAGDPFCYSFDNGRTEMDISSLSWNNPITVITREDPRWDRIYQTLSDFEKEGADKYGTLSFKLENKYLTFVTANLNVSAGLSFSVYDGKYGVKPNFIGSAALYDGDTLISEGTVSEGYIVSFDLTGHKWDGSKSYTVKVTFYDANSNNAVRYGTMTWYPSRHSSPKTEYHLITDFSWKLGDGLSELEPDPDGPQPLN